MKVNKLTGKDFAHILATDRRLGLLKYTEDGDGRCYRAEVMVGKIKPWEREYIMSGKEQAMIDDTRFIKIRHYMYYHSLVNDNISHPGVMELEVPTAIKIYKSIKQAVNDYNKMVEAGYQCGIIDYEYMSIPTMEATMDKVYKEKALMATNRIKRTKKY